MFSNEKGSIGKSTSSVDLGAALAAVQGRLVVDFDPKPLGRELADRVRTTAWYITRAGDVGLEESLRDLEQAASADTFEDACARIAAQAAADGVQLDSILGASPPRG